MPSLQAFECVFKTELNQNRDLPKVKQSPKTCKPDVIPVLILPLLDGSLFITNTLSDKSWMFKACTPAPLSTPCSVCSFTPPHGLTKKMMAKDGWRLLLSPTLIQCQCSARVCRRRGRGWLVVGLNRSLLREDRGLQ